MEFLFRHRGAGKRQVKPSQDIALLEDQLAAESSDDSEYKVGSDNDNSNDESNANDSSSSSGNESEGDEDMSEDEENPSKGELEALKKDDHENLTTKELLTMCRQELDHGLLPKWVGTVKICGCCLGQSSNDANEIVECDGCGVSVHEGCYGITETAGSVASTVSSASTEPWFCEPCRAGLDSSPNCELCPLIGGVYKQTDVGRWVHLVCALYVPGVAFGDPENMTKVTIFEMNYVSWGRRICSLCSVSPKESELSGGVRLSRTGVCIQCDAGLCKSYFHVSCAQAAGFLSEPTYVTSAALSADDVRDQYLAHCKVHSDPTVIKRRKRSYMLHLVQSRLRRQKIKTNRTGPDIESTDERILRKLNRSQVHYKAERVRGHDPWVPTQKLPRLLSTSASAIRKLQRMGEIHHHIDADEQVRQEVQVMSIVEAKKKWGVTPAFNVEYVAYYQDRERRIKDLKKQISYERKDFEELRNEDTDVMNKYNEVIKKQKVVNERNSATRRKVELLRSILGQGGQDMPKAIPPVVPSRVGTSSTAMGIKARSTAYSAAQLLSQSDSFRHLKACGICSKSHDQHLLVHCDTCQLHYHLGCLTPPLTRMPKKTKSFGWSCSECYPDSSGDELKNPTYEFDEDLGNEGTNRRKRQKRQAASKALLASSSANNSDEESQIMRKVIQESVETAAQQKIANGLNEQREDLIAKAAAKAERKRLKKEEKARRKAEKKAEKKRILEAQNGAEADDDSDIQVVEESNGVCTVSIEPKPIKLTIKTNGHHHHHDSKRLKTSPPTPKPRDVMTQCDQCSGPGNNANLVRCDDCRKCFHFACLYPPLKKSPKVPGYGWTCIDCSANSDWNLD